MVIRAFNAILTHSVLLGTDYGLLLSRNRSVQLLNCVVLLFTVLVTRCWMPVSNTCFTVFLCRGSAYCPHGPSLVSCV